MTLRAVGLKAAVLIAVACFLVAPATSASAADAKDPCKSGGYASYVDPGTGQPFANQGQCVSFVANGGTLVPVPPSQPGIVVAGGWTVNYSDDPTTEVGGDACSFTAVGVTDTTSPDPSEGHTVTVLRNGEIFYSGLTALPENLGDFVVPNGTTTTLIVDGVVLGSWLSQPGCPLVAA